MSQYYSLLIVGLLALTGCMQNAASNSSSLETAKIASSSVSVIDAVATPINVFITHLYQTALNRNPDSSGLSYWISTYNKGAGCKSIAQGILQASENTLRNQLLMNSTDPTYAALYVHELYTILFNRTPDQAGSSFWVSSLQSGVSVQTVENGFLNSPEFQTVCQTYGV